VARVSIDVVLDASVVIIIKHNVVVIVSS